MVVANGCHDLVESHIWLVVEPTPSEKYESNWKSSPILGVKIKKYLKPPPSTFFGHQTFIQKGWKQTETLAILRTFLPMKTHPFLT